MDFLRKQKNNKRLDTIFDGRDVLENLEKTGRYDPDKVMDKEEITELIKKEIPNLSAEEEVMRLYLKEWKYEEIEEITGKPMGTVKNQIARGKEKIMNNIIQKYGKENIYGLY